MVIRKVAVHFAEEFNHLATQGAENTGRGGTGHAVARVNHDLHGARQMNVADNALAVIIRHVHRAHAAARLQYPGFVLHHLAQGRNFVAINGAATHDHFEAVVVFGVVAAGDLNAAGAQRVRREIQHGRGAHAHINHLHTRGHQTAHQSRRQGRATQAPITSHGHRGLPLGQRLGAKGLAQTFGHGFVDGGRHDAANVIRFENAGGDVHERLIKKIQSPIRQA